MRKPREEMVGGIYHVGARGSCKRSIYLDDEDRSHFLWRLGRIVRREAWSCLTYCLMTNHFHLLLLLGERGMSFGMQQLLSGYARATNQRYAWCDHLFKQHFFSERIETDEQLLETSRYIVLNPVRAGLCGDPADWPWSSYRAIGGLEFAPDFLAVDRLLMFFGSEPARARKRYRDVVAATVDPTVSDTVTVASPATP